MLVGGFRGNSTRSSCLSAALRKVFSRLSAHFRPSFRPCVAHRRLMRASGGHAKLQTPPTWRVPMQRIHKTIATLTLMATALAGAALDVRLDIHRNGGHRPLPGRVTAQSEIAPVHPSTHTGILPMQSTRKMIANLAMIATVLAGAAMLSGWLSVAMAGGAAGRIRTPGAAGAQRDCASSSSTHGRLPMRSTRKTIANLAMMPRAGRRRPAVRLAIRRDGRRRQLGG